MGKKYQNKKHLAWIHEFQCVLHRKGHCHYQVQAHHLMKPWRGFRGMGMKATDHNLIPLCQRCHMELHKRGDEFAFFREQTGNHLYGQEMSKAYWMISPFNDDEERPSE